MLQGNAQGTLPGYAPAWTGTSAGGRGEKLPQSPPKAQPAPGEVWQAFANLVHPEERTSGGTSLVP